MFGLLTPTGDYLTEEQYRRYRAWYCGLCRSLRELHGDPAGLTLTYDLTFLTILLSSLYEPETTSGDNNCIAHPFKKRVWLRNEFSDYAADLNIILAYYKCLDSWNDECDPMMRAASAIYRPLCMKAAQKWPRQYKAIEKNLSDLALLEQNGCNSPDEPAACFGALLGELFVYDPDDRWAASLRALGDNLGRFIYLMDAILDLEDDVKWARFNPFSEYAGKEHNEAFFREALSMILGDCIRPFDMLPLVQDADILKNILCVGVWTEYHKKFGQEKGSSDVSGSV